MNIPGKYIRIILAVLAGLLLTGGVVRVRAVETKVQETQEHMADEVLRFHVLANSDTKEDQNLKMKVKDQVIGYLEETMGPETESLDETKEFVKAHIPEIEKEAKKIVEQEGYSYPVKVRLEKTDFPEKTYGDVTFPAGTYEALRIEIGNGDGKNWWCVLYPALCTNVAKTEESLIKTGFSPEQIEILTNGESPKYKIKFKFLEIFGEAFSE